MFEQSLMDTAIARTRTPWAMALSCGLQLMALGVMVLIPLLNYYELPASELMVSSCATASEVAHRQAAAST